MIWCILVSVKCSLQEPWSTEVQSCSSQLNNE